MYLPLSASNTAICIGVEPRRWHEDALVAGESTALPAANERHECTQHSCGGLIVPGFRARHREDLAIDEFMPGGTLCF
jgi:hypothetical protein